MICMFFKTARFNQPLDKWDVSQVVYMADRFAYTRYNRRLRAWKLALLKDARGMFEYSSSEKYTDELPVRYYTDMIFLKKNRSPYECDLPGIRRVLQSKRRPMA